MVPSIEHVIIKTLSSFQVSSLRETRKINRSTNLCTYYVAYRATARVFSICIPSLSPPSLLLINPYIKYFYTTEYGVF